MFLLCAGQQEAHENDCVGSKTYMHRVTKALVLTLYKKWSFPLRISSVNVTKSAGNCGFGHIYCRNP